MASLDDLLREFEDLPVSITVKRSESGGVTASSTASLISQKSYSEPVHKPQVSPSSSPQIRIPFLHSQSVPAQTYPKSQSLSSNSVDLLLQDLDIHLASSTSSTSSASQLTTTVQPQSTSILDYQHRKNSLSGGSSKAKCITLFLGGTEHDRGRNGASLGTLTCCNSMRCTKCDFKVLAFNDQEWDSSADYLFFRNNYPTTDKLEPLLTCLSGSVAYCCQCSWIATAQDMKVDYSSDLRWVCAGH